MNPWVEGVVAILLLASGLLTVVGALGFVRLKTFFERMHPPALGYTLGSWCVTLASIIYFSALNGRLELKTWLIIILLSITVPITTIMLSRAALFRMRDARDPTVPPPLSHPAPPDDSR